MLVPAPALSLSVSPSLSISWATQIPGDYDIGLKHGAEGTVARGNSETSALSCSIHYGGTGKKYHGC